MKELSLCFRRNATLVGLARIEGEPFARAPLTSHAGGYHVVEYGRGSRDSLLLAWRTFHKCLAGLPDWVPEGLFCLLKPAVGAPFARIGHSLYDSGGVKFPGYFWGISESLFSF